MKKKIFLIFTSFLKSFSSYPALKYTNPIIFSFIVNSPLESNFELLFTSSSVFLKTVISLIVKEIEIKII